MKEKPDVLHGTLALMVLKTLDVLGPQHGYGIARRFCRPTVTGRKQQTESRDCKQTAAVIARFFAVKAEDLP
jgi:PadR family transcriptional regulator, regulatory protein PadR